MRLSACGADDCSKGIVVRIVKDAYNKQKTLVDKARDLFCKKFFNISKSLSLESLRNVISCPLVQVEIESSYVFYNICHPLIL